MRETFASSDYCDDDYPLPQSDPLHVLSSTLWVVEQGEYVWINEDQVDTPTGYRKILSEELQHVHDLWHPITEIFDPINGRADIKTDLQAVYWT